MSRIKNVIYDEEIQIGLNRNSRHGNKTHLCGLWRGVCVENRDPKTLGRIKVRVFELHGDEEAIEKEDIPWANACVPAGGGSDYGIFDTPEIGSSVWIMFEQGDTEYPVWVGCWIANPGLIQF